jgi:hypothetical protein
MDAWENFIRWKIRLSGTFTLMLEVRSGISYFEKTEEGEIVELSPVGWGHGIDAPLYSLINQAIDKTALENDQKRVKALFDLVEIANCGIKRFDKTFRNFQIFQVIRFFILDIIIPLLAGIWAIYLLL